jgi:quinoprotein glucose dehydrogenase
MPGESRIPEHDHRLRMLIPSSNRRHTLGATALACCLGALAGPGLAAQEPEDKQPRQVVSSRSPVRTATTFAYRFRKTPATLEWADGKTTLTTTQLPAGEREYDSLALLGDGDLLRLERCPVIKLATDAPLQFDMLTLPTGNVAPGYAGVYAVWLQRTGDGWEMLFNDEADSWGTQHDPAFDRGAAPAIYERRPGETEPLSGVLEGVADEATLRLTWGEHQWTASFRVARADTGGPADADADRSRSTGDWPHHGADLGASRYAAVDQIDASNVGELEVAWRWTSPDEAIRREHPELRSLRHEAIPLAVGGRLYTVSSLSQLAAIDGGSGRTLWIHDPGSWRAGPPTNLGFVHRGAALWRDPDSGRARLLYATSDSWLIAVDAAKGKPIAGFGEQGRVDLVAGIERARRPETGHGRGNYTVSSPPLVVGDVVIVGSSIADRPNTRAMPRGDVRGYSARSGELLWTFHTIPQEGEYGNDTWLDESWRTTGNTNVWTMMSGDEELGLAYLPVTTPTSDYYGAYRRGAGLFAESLVALDAATGRRVWHFQGVHHGLWDYDFPAAPNLVDIDIDGQPIRAVAQISKQGFTYVFDRATGKPLWPIEERPVPPSRVPGEEAWPTQPFPSRPPPFERQGSTEEDVIDFSPELHAEALEILRRYEHGPLYTPPSEHGTLQLPGSAGGANWGGAAFDPQSATLFVPSLTVPIVASVSKGDPERTEFEWVGAREFGYGLREPLGPRGLPIFKPPYARVTAIDLRHGEIRWQSPVGQGPRRLVAELTGVDPGPLGSSSGLVQALATPTLLLVTKASGREADDPGGVWAFDKTDGHLVAFVELDSEPGGSPITYLHDGRQMLVVATAQRQGPQELVALALPASRTDAP